MQTNVIGAENVVSTAIANDVPRTLALSSDKAVNPVNLYGSTKLEAEKICPRATPMPPTRRLVSRPCATATSWAAVGASCRYPRPSAAPRIPSVRITELAEALAPGAEWRITGIRPGEKLHEVLVTEDESRHTVVTDYGFMMAPEDALWRAGEIEIPSSGVLPKDFASPRTPTNG